MAESDTESDTKAPADALSVPASETALPAGSPEVGLAREAIAKAHAAGARGQWRRSADGKGGLTAAQVQLRNSAIVLGGHAGIPQTELGKSFGITRAAVRKIQDAFRLRSTALEARPMEIIERSLKVYEQQMADALMVAVDTLERAPAVAIAAMKLHHDLHDRYLALLTDLGKLPENLELFRAESELMRLGELMLSKLLEVESGELSALEAAQFVRGAVLSHAPLPTIDAAPADRAGDGRNDDEESQK